MAGKMLGENCRAELLRIAQDHEQVARSLEGNMISGSQRPTETD